MDQRRLLLAFALSLLLLVGYQELVVRRFQKTPPSGPVSGQPAEQYLDGAAQMIEILTLLELKTRGNLTLEERQFLEQVLYELRLRFVEATGGGKRIIEP